MGAVSEPPQTTAAAAAAAAAATSPGAVMAARAVRNVSMYVWTAVALAVGVTAVVLGWHSQGGTTNPRRSRPVTA